MILSILIPSIPEREKQLSKLVSELNWQITNVKGLHPSLGDVEVLIDSSKRYVDGGMTVGAKRNKLVQSATGKYLCFLDDDDLIAPNYIEELLRGCNLDVDCVGFMSIFKCDFYWGIADMSLMHDNEQAHPSVFRRKIWHVCPIRTSIAQKYSFNDINNAEDWQWMEKVYKDLKQCVSLGKVLHQYNHSQLTSAVDEIERINS